MSNSRTKNSVESSDAKPSLLEKVSTKLPAMGRGQKAAAAGLGVAAAAAVGAAVRHVRKSRSRSDETEIENVYHFKPDGEGWKLTLDGATGVQASFETKREGLDAARTLASENSPSELVIHLQDGSEQTRHRYGV